MVKAWWCGYVKLDGNDRGEKGGRACMEAEKQHLNATWTSLSTPCGKGVTAVVSLDGKSAFERCLGVFVET
jgi:hypothetical protein